MLTAKCRICNEELVSPLIATSPEKKAVAIGKLTVQHMEQRHKEQMIEVILLNRQFNGFVVMNQFLMGDEEITKIMEDTRDRLAEKVMQYAPETLELEEEVDGNEEDQEFENSDRSSAKHDSGDREDEDDDTIIVECPECGTEIEVDLSEYLEEETEEIEETVTETIEEVRAKGEKTAKGVREGEGQQKGQVIDVTPVVVSDVKLIK